MTREELTDRKDRYLAKRSAIDFDLDKIRRSYADLATRFENLQLDFDKIKLEDDELKEKIESIKTAAANLGTLPTLTKLREFLQTIKEIIE